MPHCEHANFTDPPEYGHPAQPAEVAEPRTDEKAIPRTPATTASNQPWRMSPPHIAAIARVVRKTPQPNHSIESARAIGLSTQGCSKAGNSPAQRIEAWQSDAQSPG